MKISRKSFIWKSLAVLGSLGTGVSAYRWGRPAAAVMPGEMVGANARIAHLLREGKLGVPDRTERQNVVIVGSGIAGLAAARALRRAGMDDFRVLELEEHTGGNSCSGAGSGVEYPWGAHYLPLPNPENRELLAFLEEHEIVTGYDEAGRPVYNEYYLCFDPEDRLFIKGHWQEGLIPHYGVPDSDQQEISRFFARVADFRAARGRDGKWAFTIPLAECSTDEAFRCLDRLSMHQYLRREGFRSSYLYWYLNYCCRDDYGSELEDTSAWAGMHYFAARKAVAANAGGSAVLTWPEGNGFLVKQLRKSCENQLQPATLVYRVSFENDEVILDTLQWRTNELLRIRARKAIMAVPQFVAQRMLPVTPGRNQTMYNAFTYAPWMVANLTLTQRPEPQSGAPLSWDNVLYGGRSLGYVYANHMSLATHADRHVLTYYVPLSWQPPKMARIQAYRRSHAAWSAMIVEELERVHPNIREMIERIDVKVWGHGMIRPTPGFIAGNARENAARPMGNALFFAHSDLSGISIFEEAFYQGSRAAAELLQSFQSPVHG